MISTNGDQKFNSSKFDDWNGGATAVVILAWIMAGAIRIIYGWLVESKQLTLFGTVI